MIDAKFLSLAEQFRKRGFNLYMVGGTARDYLLKHPIMDMDLATDASPEALIEILPNADKSFLNYGVIRLKEDEYHIDIVSFRLESNYEDFRHPQKISFTTSMMDDAKRRDFTINALYIDSEGRIYDFYHGMDDLNHGLIRTIGNPSIRFHEDPLRILRCLRFSLTLGFNLEEHTEKALIDSIPLLAHLNPHKVQEEITKMERISKTKTQEILEKYNIHFS